MYKKIILSAAVIILIAWLINSYFFNDEANPNIPENKKDEKNIPNNEDQQNESGSGGDGSGSFGTGSSISGGSVGEISSEGEGEGVTELTCTGEIDFSTEININNEETTTDDEVILVIQNNDNSIYQNFNVYVDDLLEGTITLNGGGIANIISNEMTTWWQSLDLSQVVSRTFNIKVTNEDDCEVTNSVTLNYPYEGAPWD